MDGEVARTLAELERKLQELELALATARQEQPPASGAPAVGSPPPPGGARLIDEDLEGAAATSAPAGGPADLTPPAAPTAEPPATHGSPAAPIAEPPATHGSPATPAFAPPAPLSPQTTPIAGTTAPPVSAPPSADDSIELAELSRFRDRLEQMTRELVADYERVIRLRRPGQASPPGEGF